MLLSGIFMKAEECSVLVVDRDVHLRQLIADFLQDTECTPEFFDDGYAALDHARREPPSIIITEILVPRLDGLALCRLIKGDPALERTKVMVLSVLSAEERAQRSGADVFMAKPIERATLVAALRSLIEPAGAGEQQ